MTYFEPLFRRLNEANVRYVVVGGLATVLHGYARFTADIDLVIDLEPSSARNAIETLTEIGLVPRVPVPAGSFADPEKRAEWIQSKNMQVFSMIDPDLPLRSVDLFLESPIDFAQLWQRSEELPLDSTSVRVASLADLIRTKEIADRPQDRLDVAELRKIEQQRKLDE